MPELPDITVYVERLEALVAGRTLQGMRLSSPFLLRTVDPPLDSFSGREVTGVLRRGKRIVFAFAGGSRLALHLMIAGRLHWKAAGAPVPKGNGLMAMDFAEGSLILTESGIKKRAALFAFPDQAALEAKFPVGLEPLDAGLREFAARLRLENHTLKRALTDPRLFSGIGNSYSDEILHQAKLSPVMLTGRMGDAEIAALYAATRDVLSRWTEALREETGEGFPEKVTAFRKGMAVHGRYGQPCPVCGSPVQRIRYAENETNYCPTCQTGGKLLADRALSSLLKKDWPRSLEDMEKMLARHKETIAGGEAGMGAGTA
ncbi:MAG: formamidopyrimidine-DNA glycosylase [Fibrobacteres bacterium]|jgi:formamidopyrimidine-DNA glycosylase|nr:formamidopyrimidine-DNA glycosylase [Fibrobacterota bacterium]